MATSSPVRDVDNIPPQDKWGPPPDVVQDHLGHVGPGDLERDLVHGAPPHNGDALGPPLDHGDAYLQREPSEGDSHKSGPIYREKQIKPNKVYIGGLPEHTRQEDLRNCFGKIGEIVNIELKLGYGFVEFTSREAAEESVAKYHEGTFMGNKIRVELSHGGGRTAKYTGDPGACFKCGQHGHWARECPNHVIQVGPGPHRRSNPATHIGQDPLVDRASSREYPPPARDYPAYREDYGRYPPRDARYGYDYPPPGREYRRPPSPPREYRDYAYPRRDYDDYRMRPPPPPPPSRGYYPDGGPTPGYPPRSYDVPRDAADRRAAPPPERYPPYPPPGARPRTPPGPPPRVRDDYERVPRDYAAPPPAAEYRGRPVSPPPSSARYGDYPPRTGGSEQSLGRYRHRSQSPVTRNGSGTYRSGSYVNDQGPESAPYTSAGAGASYSSSAGAYSGNGYSGGPTGSVPPRGGGGVRDREYTPRNGGADVNAGYSRRA